MDTENNRRWLVWAPFWALVIAGLFYCVYYMKSEVDARDARPKPAAKVVVVDSTGKAVEQPPASK